MTNSFPPDLPPTAQAQTPPVPLLPEAPAPEQKEIKLKDLVKSHRELMVEKMVDIINTGSHSNIIRAVEWLSGYSDGKPKQEIENTHVVSYLDVLKHIGETEKKFQAITQDPTEPTVDVEVLPPPPPRKSRLADFV